MNPRDPYLWHPLLSATWERCVARARELNKRANVASWTRRWGSDGILKGVIGEEFWGWLTGEEPNQQSQLGDGGEDFPGLDVKATGSAPPQLRVTVGQCKAEMFACVQVDLERRRVRLIGYATRAMLLASQLQELETRSHVLEADELLTADQLLVQLVRERRALQERDRLGNQGA